MKSKQFTFEAEGKVTTNDDTVILTKETSDKNKTTNIGATIARELDLLENEKVKITVTVEVERL